MRTLWMVVFLLTGSYANSQVAAKDTLKPKPDITHFLKIIDGTYGDTLTRHVWLLGNPDCHRCEEVKAKFKEYSIDFLEYDVRESEILGIAYELVRKYEKSEKLSFSFPIVVVNTRVYYNFPDIGVMVEEIRKSNTRN